ncbi:MAG: hypothetical protein K0S01_2638 [Herbinix sp.]|jgi:poly-gamma-glutamate synthesis protein (capsule biosynthesis protein)|nr:hypothetical protein [Herbinix sp.]
MKIAFLGDIALIGRYDITQNENVKERLEVIANKLLEYDYVIANLESPLTDKTTSIIPKSMHLRTPVVNVELLNYLHINAVSLANNHLFDFGKKGLEDTINALESHDVEWFGANSKNLLKEFNGEKICFSGFCCYSTNGTGYIEENNKIGINTLTYDNIIQQLEKDKNNKAFSILSFHWGTEHTNYPKYDHIRLAETIAMKKNSLICGHHPHIIQGVQKINDSLIAYSLGNFLFDDSTSIKGNFTIKQNENNKKSFIFEVDINESKVSNCKYHGFKDGEGGFVFFDINTELQQISEPLEKIDDITAYETKRKEQFDEIILEKFGKHNLKWILNRLNYYSIGARILAIFRNKKYLREAEKFLGGSKNA